MIGRQAAARAVGRGDEREAVRLLGRAILVPGGARGCRRGVGAVPPRRAALRPRRRSRCCARARVSAGLGRDRPRQQPGCAVRLPARLRGVGRCTGGRAVAAALATRRALLRRARLRDEDARRRDRRARARARLPPLRPAAARARFLHLAAAGVSLVVGGAWIVVVDLSPVADRPWLGSTTDNSALSLAFGYNGLGRVDGQTGGTSFDGQPRRRFSGHARRLPAAERRARRPDRLAAAARGRRRDAPPSSGRCGAGVRSWDRC